MESVLASLYFFVSDAISSILMPENVNSPPPFPDSSLFSLQRERLLACFHNNFPSVKEYLVGQKHYLIIPYHPLGYFHNAANMKLKLFNR